MIIRSILYILIFFTAFNCNDTSDSELKTFDNVLLQTFKTPYELPPFDIIEDTDYIPAFKTAMQIHNSEINQIINNTQNATFENTIAVFDTCGLLLNRTEGIFKAEIGTVYNFKRQQILEEIFPSVSKHRDSIYQNELLFKKAEQVYNKCKHECVADEKQLLTEIIYKKFIQAGAKLDSEKKKKLTEINTELSFLSIKFSENLMKDNECFKLFIEDRSKLNGLPADFIENAAKLAKNKGFEKGFQIKLNRNNYYTILKYAENRTLREEIFNAFTKQGRNNKLVVNKIINLRLNKAKLFGYNTYSEYIFNTENRFLKTPDAVFRFLESIKKLYFHRLGINTKELQQLIYNEGNKFILKPWDRHYYSEKYKQSIIKINEDELSEYFELENTLSGLSLIINKLFDITIKERYDLPKFEKSIRTFEFKDSKNVLKGILYVSFYAGNTNIDYIRRQFYKKNKRVNPVVISNFNFSKNIKNGKTYLSLEQTKDLFHEFGHALHLLFNDSQHYTKTDLSFAFDFVEFPSQYLENYAINEESLKSYAKHDKTGEKIPVELVEGICRYDEFNNNFIMSERIAAAYLDMYLHSLTKEGTYDIDSFERDVMKQINLPDEIIPRYYSSYFNPIFSGDYAAGYYGYLLTNKIANLGLKITINDL